MVVAISATKFSLIGLFVFVATVVSAEEADKNELEAPLNGG